MASKTTMLSLGFLAVLALAGCAIAADLFAVRQASNGGLPNLKTCSPPCRNGQCCVQEAADLQATCQNFKLAKSSCGWTHYFSYSAWDWRTTAIDVIGKSCPCIPGTPCVSVGSKGFVCSGFK